MTVAMVAMAVVDGNAWVNFIGRRVGDLAILLASWAMGKHIAFDDYWPFMFITWAFYRSLLFVWEWRWEWTVSQDFRKRNGLPLNLSQAMSDERRRRRLAMEVPDEKTPLLHVKVSEEV